MRVLCLSALFLACALGCASANPPGPQQGTGIGAANSTGNERRDNQIAVNPPADAPPAPTEQQAPPPATCPPAGDVAACSAASDCTMVEQTCHCGGVLMQGVAKSRAQEVKACLDAHQCPLGCPSGTLKIAEDGQHEDKGRTVHVDCLPAPSGHKACRTFLR